METADAFELGLRSAGPGLFFDTMELIAAVSVSLGGFDRLESFVRTLGELQSRSAEDLEWVSRLCSAAWREPVDVPRGVDAYRTMLRERVFEIVNRWSYIQDIHTVTRLQAWFYAGFGLGRSRTVLEGFHYFQELRDSVGVVSPLDQAPNNLSRMAEEAARQLDTVAKENDFDRVRVLFEGQARVLDSYAIRLAEKPDTLTLPTGWSDDLENVNAVIRQVRLDFASKAFV